MKQQQYQKCIEACIACATECNHCAVACLEEKDVQYLTKCIRLNLECAVICRASAELMTLGSAYSSQICDLCATICRACAEICEQHADMGMEHCRECAEACRACVKETMEVYENLDKQGNDTEAAAVHQGECAILSRVSAELMSLESAYCKQICELTARACNASAETVEKYLNMEMKNSKECAVISKEAQQHAENQNKEINPEVEDGNEQPEQKKDSVKKKKKHSSALLAASMWRSPVSAVRSSTYSGGGVENTGIWTEFRERGGIN